MATHFYFQHFVLLRVIGHVLNRLVKLEREKYRLQFSDCPVTQGKTSHEPINAEEGVPLAPPKDDLPTSCLN
jgi:hypothetical protein